MVFYQQLIISNAPVGDYRILITYRPVASDIEEVLYFVFCFSQKEMKKVLKLNGCRPISFKNSYSLYSLQSGKYTNCLNLSAG